jgi:uncharacterized protein GlcG (DUF336 family)
MLFMLCRSPLVHAGALLLLFSGSASGQNATSASSSSCQGLPSKATLKAAVLKAAHNYGTIGGLFQGTRMWGAVVNRDGEICSFVTSTGDPTKVWPGSQAIAKAKANTANAFSLSTGSIGGIAGFPLSTAQLYTFVQPGHSLFGLNNSNVLDPDCLAPPSGRGGGAQQICGGIITFGGGVALYQSGKAIGGLGISGDTACADHEIARNTRDALGLNPPGGATVDDISYSSEGGASVFTHPLCPNTYHRGTKVGDELAATGY